MQNKTISTVLVTILFIVVIAGLYYLGKMHGQQTGVVAPIGQTQTRDNPNGPDYQPMPGVLGNKDDLISSSVRPGETMTGKLTLIATVQNGYFFEGNVAVAVVDASGNMLVQTHGTATTEWMTTGPVTFSADIDISGVQIGAGYIVISADNPSGLPENNKEIRIPVLFQ